MKIPTSIQYWPVAQTVERHPVKVMVVGSIPTWPALIICVTLHQTLKIMLRKIIQVIMRFFRKLFNPPQEPIVHPTKRILSFAINNYPGTENDLRGCINDQYNVKGKFDDEFPDFSIDRVANTLATVGSFKKKLGYEIDILRPNSGDILLVHYSGHGTYVKDRNGDEADGYDEALYLYDGVLIDDDIREILDKIPEGVTVVLMFDSCFSGTITKSLVSRPEKIRFVQTENQSKEVMTVRSRVAVAEDMRWITFSGSGEHQTSADAFIDGKYNGAFTYFAMKALQTGITYNQWFYRVKNLFEASRFEQRPQMDGNEALRNNLVFS